MWNDRYQRLRSALMACGVPFAEYDWATRPAGEYGTVSIDTGANQLNGSNERIAQAVEGSIELYITPNNDVHRVAVEAALRSVCGGAWKLDEIAFDRGVRLQHLSYVFQLR